MIKIFRKHQVLLFLLAISYVFCGCESSKVKSAVAAESPNVEEVILGETGQEEFELLSEEVINEESATKAYYLKSKQRDLMFTAMSLLDSELWQGEITDSFLELGEVKNDYVSKISNIYYPEIKDIVLKYENSMLDKVMYDFTRGKSNLSYVEDEFVGNYLYEADLESPCLIAVLRNEEDIIPLAEILARAGSVYARELDYHNAEFLEKNPVAAVKIILCEDDRDVENLKSLASGDDVFWLENCECIKTGRAGVIGRVQITSNSQPQYYKQKLNTLYDRAKGSVG